MCFNCSTINFSDIISLSLLAELEYYFANNVRKGEGSIIYDHGGIDIFGNEQHVGFR